VRHLNIEFLGTMPDVQKVRGLAALAYGRVVLIAASLIGESYCKDRMTTGWTAESYVVAVRISGNFITHCIQYQEIRDLQRLQLSCSVA